jgi:U6 snRNA-associated Sm-like protein LSm6
MSTNTNEVSSISDAVASKTTTTEPINETDPTTTTMFTTANEVGATTTAPPKKSKTPSDFLKSILGRPIRVKLNSGIEYRGVLGSLDGYLNIAIEQTEEYSTTGQLQAKYGDCFIRGNNGTLIKPVRRGK